MGGTDLGKSMLAGDVLRTFGRILNVPGFLEIIVEDDASLDLSDFRLDRHAGILLDGSGTHREIMLRKLLFCDSLLHTITQNHRLTVS